MDLVESEKVFSMKEIHAESPFPCDYVRNGYCKGVITSTAESKRVFFNHKLHTEDEDYRLLKSSKVSSHPD